MEDHTHENDEQIQIMCLNFNGRVPSLVEFMESNKQENVIYHTTMVDHM